MPIEAGRLQPQVVCPDPAHVEQPFRPSDVLLHQALHALQQDYDARWADPFGLACGDKREVRHTQDRRHRIAQLVGGDCDEVVPGTDRLAQLLDLPSQVGQLGGGVIGRSVRLQPVQQPALVDAQPAVGRFTLKKVRVLDRPRIMMKSGLTSYSAAV